MKNGFEAWLDEGLDGRPCTVENYLGLRREFRMDLEEFKITIIGDCFVSDIRRRTWLERLRSKPWISHVKERYAYAMKTEDAREGWSNIIVSIKTFLELEAAEHSLNEDCWKFLEPFKLSK